MMKSLNAKTIFEAPMLLLSIGSPPRLKPPLGDLPPFALQQVPLSQWLDETIFISGSHRVTRHELFKWAANKDGGAHVDLNDLPAAYEAYKASGAVGTVTLGGTAFPFEDAHLVAMRQFGYEVLNSPEVAALAT